LTAPLLRHLASGIEEKVNDVIIGNVTGPGGNIGRLSVLEAGLPLTIPGLTLDRQCSAGLEAIRMACYFIQGGAGHCYIAGGVESTSTSPYTKRARFSPERLGDPDMIEAAEFVAQKYRMTKDQQDEYALMSYERSWDAFEKGLYAEEILALGQWHTDEEFCKKRNMKALLKRAKPILTSENSSVTAANSCGIHDGAAAALIMEEDTALKLGYTPVLRFVDSEVAAVHPHYPGAAPIPAIKTLLNRNHLSIEDIEMIEINEAFASKVVACAQELTIPFKILNRIGGALTLGHPYGASGAIQVTRILHEVQRRKKTKYALAAIGSGGGIGLAVLFEAVRE
jgi:acetyl-CoA C-acetyltransferase